MNRLCNENKYNFITFLVKKTKWLKQQHSIWAPHHPRILLVGSLAPVRMMSTNDTESNDWSDTDHFNAGFHKVLNEKG